MATRKFLDLDGLKEYDSLIKTEIEEAVSGKAPLSHNHDDRYYTETEVDTQLEGYVSKQDTPFDGVFMYTTEDYITYLDKNYPLIQAAVSPASPYTIPIRAAGSGAVRVGEPVESSDATTKKYVDTNISLITESLTAQLQWNSLTENYIANLNQKTAAIEDAFDDYYTKTAIDSMEFITVDDIDEICGSSVYDGTVVIS